jgi:hypothetical protein
LQAEVCELKKTLEHVRSDLVLVRLIHAPSDMTSPPITVSLTAAPLPTSVVPGLHVVGPPADASVGVVAPEGLEDPRKSEQEQGMLLASPTGLKDTLKSEQEQSQLVVVVASEGLKDTRKSEQDQGKFKLKAFFQWVSWTPASPCKNKASRLLVLLQRVSRTPAVPSRNKAS